MTITREQFQKIVYGTFESINKLNESKGEEYTGSQGVGNVHANFDRLSAKLNIIPEKVLWVYLTKHLDGIENYINELQATTRRKLSEPIEGRIDDAILYLLLAKAMVIRMNKINVSEPMPGEYTEVSPDSWKLPSPDRMHKVQGR